MMFLTPAFIRIFEQATPEAPTPLTTTLRSPILSPVILQALSSAASTTIAVPCWSSWKTGMSSISLRRSSTSKHTGAAMSSRLIPPQAGAMAAIVLISTSGSFESMQMG